MKETTCREKEKWSVAFRWVQTESCADFQLALSHKLRCWIVCAVWVYSPTTASVQAVQMLALHSPAAACVRVCVCGSSAHDWSRNSPGIPALSGIFLHLCSFILFFLSSTRFHYLNSSRHVSAPVYTTVGESVCFYWSSAFRQGRGQFKFGKFFSFITCKIKLSLKYLICHIYIICYIICSIKELSWGNSCAASEVVTIMHI